MLEAQGQAQALGDEVLEAVSVVLLGVLERERKGAVALQVGECGVCGGGKAQA